MAGMKQRIISAAVMIPVLVAIVLIPFANHILFLITVISFTFLGSREMNAMLSKQPGELSPMAMTGFLLPIAQYIQYSFFRDCELTFYTLMFLMGLSFVIEVFTGCKDNFKGTWERNSKTVLNIIYPGLFASFMVRVSFYDNCAYWLLLFFALVCGSDTFAYFSGVLFGRNNKGVIKVSPNKSVAGFCGGILVPALTGMAAAMIFPEIYQLNPVEGFFVGFGTALVGTVGDLIESSFKRSASVKDSGKIVMGRGGIMDTIDSIIMAAPVYCALAYLATLV